MKNIRIRFYKKDAHDRKIPWVMILDSESVEVETVRIEEEVKPITDTKPTYAKAGEALTRWVTVSNEINPIPGTDELRADFMKEYNDSRNDPNCPSNACHISRLIGKYRRILEAGGYIEPR
jgi:hypothetical protein